MLWIYLNIKLFLSVIHIGGTSMLRKTLNEFKNFDSIFSCALEKLWIMITVGVEYVGGTWLYPRRSIGTSRRKPSRSATTFLVSFLFFYFYRCETIFRVSPFVPWEIFKFWTFFLHSRMLPFLFFILVCVEVTASPTLESKDWKTRTPQHKKWVQMLKIPYAKIG